MYVGPVRSDREWHAAVLLASGVFGPLGGLSGDEATTFKEWMWNEPGYNRDNLLVLSPKSGEICGMVRLLPRVLRRGRQAFSGVLLSSVCIAPAWRGRGLSRLLMDEALLHAQKAGHTLAILFARRVVDGYYPRFDFWGISAYNSVLFAKSSLQEKGKSVTIYPARKNDISLCATLHEECYGTSFGFVERSLKYWMFHLQRFRRQGGELLMFIQEGRPLGYALSQGGILCELGLREPQKASDILAAFPFGGENAQCRLPATHPVLPYLHELDVTLTHRHCSYGGHMVAVLSRNAMLDALELRAAKVGSSRGFGPFCETLDEVKLTWDGTRCTATLLQADKTVLGLPTTARLLGASSPCLAGCFALESLLPFNVNSFDQC